jgi:hypothetical protein
MHPADLRMRTRLQVYDGLLLGQVSRAGISPDPKMNISSLWRLPTCPKRSNRTRTEMRQEHAGERGSTIEELFRFTELRSIACKRRMRMAWSGIRHHSAQASCGLDRTPSSYGAARARHATQLHAGSVNLRPFRFANAPSHA